MKLLFFISSLMGGGAERVMTVLTNELVDRGHSVKIGVMTNTTVFYDLHPEIVIEKFDFKKSESLYGKLKNRRKLLSFIRSVSKETKPDVIISFIYQMNTNVLLSTRFLNIPVVVSEHNTLDRNMSFIERLQRLYISKMADKLTLLTEHDYHYLGNKLKNKVVMSNPLSFEPIKRFNDDREKVVLAVGSVKRYKHKGFDNLVEIWGHIGDKYPDWKLRIVGDFDLDSVSYLKDIENKIGISNKIEFVGQVKNISDLLKESSIFVLSSRWEGLPMVLMEAMSQGCACCSYDVVSGPNEIITHGYDGVLVENQNKEKMIHSLVELIENDVKRTCLAENAIKSIKRFSVSEIVDSWESLLEEVVN